MNGWKKVGLPLTGVTAIGLVLGLMTSTTSGVTGCSSSNDNSNGSSSSGGSGSSSGSLPRCPDPRTNPLTPGTFPPPDCVNSDESACGEKGTGACNIAASCGDKKTCMPLADNSSKTTWDMRMRAISIVAPASLNNPVVQGSVVTHGVDLNLPQCGENGDGSFSWLLSFDSTTNKLTTGGAPPAPDPTGAGYCFVKTTLPSGLPLTPVTVSMTKNADGTYDSDTLDQLNIPIYYISNGQAQIIVLPVSGGAMKGLQFNSNNNCIGGVDTSALDSKCGESDSTTCSKWQPHGSIAGYITLQQADKVDVPLLASSLCTVLTGAGTACPNPDGTSTKRCACDGNITQKGDYCSTTKTAGGCQDSYWLAAVFAASAVKINDGTGTPDCQGSTTGGGDAGADTGSSSGGSDSGSD